MDLHTTCASCKMESCFKGDKENMPKNCPMRCSEYMSTIFSKYEDPEIHKFYQATKMCVGTEDEHRYTPRMRTLIDLCKYMGYKKIGMAFCCMFWEEAELYAKIIRQHGIEVVSACCLNGGFNITEHDVPLPDVCVKPGFDPACNPIGQAILLNEQKTEFNVVIGLCLGHDSLFMKYSDAMCTVMAIKDVAMANGNPLNALKLYRNYPEIFFGPSPRERREAEAAAAAEKQEEKKK